MTDPKARNLDRFLILLTGLAVSLALSSSPAFSKGKPTDDPPEPEPPSCEGLTNDFDRDQDGFPDLIDCEGLQSGNGGNGAEFDYPGCVTSPETAPHCTDHTLADVFAEVRRDTTSTGVSAFDELGISDDEVFSFAEGSLALNVHVVPEGTLGANRVVLTYLFDPKPERTQAGVILTEDRGLVGSCSSPQSTGFSFLGNPNEFGSFEVLTQRIFDQIDCIGGTTEQKRQHVLNTSSHELGHGMRQAPDPNTFHQQTVGDCIMEASIEPDRRNRLTIPTSFCSNSQATVLAGATTQGPTLCGDVTTFDGDGTFECLPAGQ